MTENTAEIPTADRRTAYRAGCKVGGLPTSIDLVPEDKKV